MIFLFLLLLFVLFSNVPCETEQQKDLFSTADELHILASNLMEKPNSKPETEAFFTKATHFLCSNELSTAENDDNLSSLEHDKVLTKYRHTFCHQIKEGKSIWEAVDSAGDGIITAAKKLEFTPQIYENLRKIAQSKIFNKQNGEKFGMLVKNAFVMFNKFLAFINDEQQNVPSFVAAAADGQNLAAEEPSSSTSPQDGAATATRRRRHNRNSSWWSPFFRQTFNANHCVLFTLLGIFASLCGIWAAAFLHHHHLHITIGSSQHKGNGGWMIALLFFCIICFLTLSISFYTVFLMVYRYIKGGTTTNG